MTTDLRYAWRAIWKNPATSLGAMLALALGIGATTAVFGLLNAVLLRPLPYPEPDRLVELFGTVQREQVERRGASFADFYDWRKEATSFDAMAAWFPSNAIVYGAGEPEAITAEVIDGPYFELLGVRPLVGRALREEDDRPGTARTIVIGERLWERRYGRSTGALGSALQVDDRVYTIVGVAPAAFRGRSDSADVWVTAAASQPADQLKDRQDRWFPVLARLRPEATVASAQAELDAIARQLQQAYPQTNEGRGVEVSPLASEVFGDIRQAVTVLSGAVVLVLLIACANVASLLLARTETRRRELSVRLALGADRRRLARLLFAESAWLVALGGGAGWLLALWASDALLALSPVQLPSFAAPGVDWRLLVFAMGLGVVTTFVVGLGPTLLRAPAALSQELRDGAAETRGTRRSRTLRAIVAGEVALAVALLVGATLLGRSLTTLMNFDPGYRTDGLLALGLQMPISVAPPEGAAPSTGGARQDGAGVAALAMLEELRAIRGVRQAALASDLPLGGSSATFYSAEGQGLGSAQTRPRAYVHRVTPGYFDTIGLRVVEGRDFNSSELGLSSTAVIVSEGVARRFWPGQSAIGRRIKRGALDGRAPWLTIVGVVEDASLRGIPRNPTADPDLYFPFNDRASAYAAVLSTDGDAAELTSAAREVVRRVDPQIAVTTAETIASRVGDQLAPVRFLSWLTGAFAFMAFALALIGIYALLAHAVRKRTREIGIRAALGAPRVSLLTMVVGQGVTLVGVGLVMGLTLAGGLSRGLSTWLFGVAPVDPASYLSVCAAVLAAAVCASLLPALRAVRVDPMVALRND